MSGFAINGGSLRAVDSAEDCLQGETFSTDIPVPWPPAPTTAQQLENLKAGVQQWLDATARANGYDSIASCCSYYNSGVVQWAADAKAATLWRDAVWQGCYAQSAAISNQASPTIPTLAALLLSLPQPATYGWATHAPGA